jgi:hypothetical protein
MVEVKSALSDAIVLRLVCSGIHGIGSDGNASATLSRNRYASYETWHYPEAKVIRYGGHESTFGDEEARKSDEDF